MTQQTTTSQPQPCHGCLRSDGYSQRCGSCQRGDSYPAGDPDYTGNPANPDTDRA